MSALLGAFDTRNRIIEVENPQNPTTAETLDATRRVDDATVAIRASISNPMKVLFWAAVINGVIAVPVMIMMILIGSNPKAMGKFTIPLHLKFLAWITVLMMFGTVAGLLVV